MVRRSRHCVTAYRSTLLENKVRNYLLFCATLTRCNFWQQSRLYPNKEPHHAIATNQQVVAQQRELVAVTIRGSVLFYSSASVKVCCHHLYTIKLLSFSYIAAKLEAAVSFLPLVYLLLGHLLSGSIPKHLMHSKDAECILMFLSAMLRGVSVAHIYVLKLPLHHL